MESELESLDREIAAINASMPPSDPEMTLGAEHLEKALVSRKRKALENDRMLALSQFYFPTPQKLLADFEDSPNLGDGLAKRPRMSFESALMEFDLGLDQQHQREIEVIMETLRFGSTMVGGGGAMAGGSNNSTTAPTPAVPATDSCGHAALLSEQSNGGGFHSLVVASLET